jgi:hypothetical protein
MFVFFYHSEDAKAKYLPYPQNSVNLEIRLAIYIPSGVILDCISHIFIIKLYNG